LPARTPRRESRPVRPRRGTPSDQPATASRRPANRDGAVHLAAGRHQPGRGREVQMNLRAALLAEAAGQNVDGAVMLWRGGITETTVSGFPSPVQYVLVLRLEADPSEARRLHEMRSTIYYSGTRLGPWQTTPLALRVFPGEPRVYLNVVVNLRFTVR